MALPEKTKKGALPILAVVGAVFLWGGSFSAMRVCVQALSPWPVMWARMAVAFACVIPFARRWRPRDFRKGDWKALLAMAAFMPCLYFWLESNALVHTTSSAAGIISALVPLMVALGAWVFLSEALTGRLVCGLLLSISGVAALTLFAEASGAGSDPLLGNILELGAMASAAGYMLLVKRLSDRYNPWTLTALQVSVGLVFFSPGIPGLLSAPAGIFSAKIILSLVFLGGGVTLLAFGLYNWGQSRIPASRASAFINLVPVVAVILGWTLLDESLNGRQLAAAAAAVAGVWLSQGKKSSQS